MRDNRKKCLVCNEPMARWIYGEPNYDTLKEEILSKKIILGGCCISNHSPIWTCQSCCISYKKDGSGFLDHDLINHRENIDFFYEQWINEALPEITPYELPYRMKAILENDFLEKLDNKKNIGFHFHHGGYDSEINDIRYLDGLLIYTHYKSTFEELYQNAHSLKLPEQILLLPKQLKVKLDTFITTSKWNKKYDNNLIMDGTQWEMTCLVQLKKKKSFGSNEFPEVYEEFINLLEEIDPELMGWD